MPPTTGSGRRWTRWTRTRTSRCRSRGPWSRPIVGPRPAHQHPSVQGPLHHSGRPGLHDPQGGQADPGQPVRGAHPRHLTRGLYFSRPRLFTDLTDLTDLTGLADLADLAMLRCEPASSARSAQKSDPLSGRWPVTMPPDTGGRGIVDLDGVLLIAHSGKEDAAATGKRTCGHHPLTAFVNHGPGGTGEPVAALLRPGNAAPARPPTTSPPPSSLWPNCPSAIGASGGH